MKLGQFSSKRFSKTFPSRYAACTASVSPAHTVTPTKLWQDFEKRSPRTCDNE